MRRKPKKPANFVKVKQLDKFCQNVLCGSYQDLEIHHIIPRANGGDHEIDNLILLCHRCHMLVTDNKISDLQILERLYNLKKFRWHRPYEYWIKRSKI